MAIPTEFLNTEIDDAEISFPDMPADVTAKITPNGNRTLVTLSVNGRTDRIRELVRNSNAYRAKVWFNNLRSDLKIERSDGRIDYGSRNSANVLKIEVFKIPPPSRR